jgi:putative ABC transport system ATP-binding protein
MDVAVAGLRHSYGGGEAERTVLSIDGWTVASGSRWLLHGVSGSGKTTLLDILSGLLPPTEGEVSLDGRSLYAESEAERDRRRATSTGYIHQGFLLVPILSALENVEMPLVFGSRLTASVRRARARDALARVGLVDGTDRRPGQLSTGQRQRVAVARALVIEPRLVLADEPTAALDEESAATVIDVLTGDSHDRGTTLIVASHDPALRSRFDHRLVLEQGRPLTAPLVEATSVAAA